MVKDISEVFRCYLASGRGPDPSGNEGAAVSEYGVSATLANNGVMDVTLTFESGRPYCCPGWQCHLWLFDGRRWAGLRKVAASREVELPALLSLRITVIVEEGSLFYDLSQPEAERLERRRFKATDSRYEESGEAYEGDEGDPED